MTGFLDGVYSKYHCDVLVGEAKRCNKPAQLRYFRDSNVVMCDDHYHYFEYVVDEDRKEGHLA